MKVPTKHSIFITDADHDYTLDKTMRRGQIEYKIHINFYNISKYFKRLGLYYHSSHVQYTYF